MTKYFLIAEIDSTRADPIWENKRLNARFSYLSKDPKAITRNLRRVLKVLENYKNDCGGCI